MTVKHSFSACLQAGCIVEFMQGDTPHLAFVLEEQSSRLRLLTITKRETKLPAARVLSWTGPRHSGERSREEILDLLAGHQQRREELAAGIDAMEIWELAQGEVEKAPLRWFAELLWDPEQAADPDRLAAMGRAMLACKTHFKYQPPEFVVFPEEKVLARQAEQHAAEERERLSNLGRQFFERIWQTRNQAEGPELLPLDSELEQQLRQLLLKRIAVPDDQETEQVWKLVRKGLPETPHLELQLAQAWGVVPPHHNFHYDQADYAPGDGWSQTHSEEIAAIRERALQAAKQVAAEAPGFVSVDSETTRDVDDAFYLERNDSGYRLQLALARPMVFWELESPLGRAVAQRATSIYLPEGDSHMLPEALGTDLFSLRAGEKRPSLVLDMELDAEGGLLSCSPRATWVQVTANESYTAVEAALQVPVSAASSQEAMMHLGAELAQKLREQRLQHGAVVIDRNDPDIFLEQQGDDVLVRIEPKPETPWSQLMVSEMMILANRALAEWAKRQGLALLHRTQDIVLARESVGVWSAPEDIHKVVRSLSSATLEVEPRAHASLGVPAYSPVTSPLRRYPDFLNMYQTQHFLEHGAPLFPREQLETLVPMLSARLEAAGRIQRFRPRYWKLLYFRQQGKDARYPAVIVDEGPHYLVLSLPREQLFVRGPRGLFGDKVFPGQRCLLRLGKIDPLHNEVHVLEAFEDDSAEAAEAASGA